MKIRKSFVYLLATFLLLSSNGVTVSAEKKILPNNSFQYTSITPYAEETTWFYRTVDGKLQKRLWSNTYGKWLTDWEWA